MAVQSLVSAANSWDSKHSLMYLQEHVPCIVEPLLTAIAQLSSGTSSLGQVHSEPCHEGQNISSTRGLKSEEKIESK